MESDPFDLARFVAAQRDTYAQALAEVRRGRKTSHWMWFVFPQLSGLGHSPTARHYAISGKAEARAYLAHPVLGPRLLEIVAAATAAAPDRSAEDIFGTIDALKLRSSLDLFHGVGGGPVFAAALARFGNPMPRLSV